LGCAYAVSDDVGLLVGAMEKRVAEHGDVEIKAVWGGACASFRLSVISRGTSFSGQGVGLACAKIG
jgi:hypothetical protein